MKRFVVALTLITSTALAQTAPTQREVQKLQEDAAYYGRTCDGIAQLEEIGRHASPSIAPRYVEEATKARDRHWHELAHGLAEYMAAIPSDFTRDRREEREIADQRDELATVTKTAHEMLDKMRCYDASRTDKMAVVIDQMLADQAKRVDDEERCRQTPACMAPRVAREICDDLERRRGTAKAIADERQNPSGVVDLVKLHSLGADLHDIDAALPSLKQRYSKLAKRSFAESLCSK